MNTDTGLNPLIKLRVSALTTFWAAIGPRNLPELERVSREVVLAKAELRPVVVGDITLEFIPFPNAIILEQAELALGIKIWSFVSSSPGYIMMFELVPRCATAKAKVIAALKQLKLEEADTMVETFFITNISRHGTEA